MIKSTNRDSSLTQGKVILWVEDKLTREYLRTIWKSDNTIFDIRFAGGKSVVKATVHDLRNQDESPKNVFGFIDKDFAESNYDKWQNDGPPSGIYIPKFHEIENYLLDWDALTNCDSNYCLRKFNEIKDRASDKANSMCWWMSCTQVLSHYHYQLVGEFPSNPKIPIVNCMSEAKNYIINEKNWHSSLSCNISKLFDDKILEKDLTG